MIHTAIRSMIFTLIIIGTTFISSAEQPIGTNGDLIALVVFGALIIMMLVTGIRNWNIRRNRVSGNN